MTLDELHISCEFLYDHTVNYAMQQNHVPLIKRLCVTNDGNKDLGQLTIKIQTEPELSLPWETNIFIYNIGNRISPISCQSIKSTVLKDLLVTI